MRRPGIICGALALSFGTSMTAVQADEPPLCGPPGGEQPATIVGSGPISGTAGDDVIVGSPGVDVIDAGDAAAIVPVGDVDALAGALARAWTDEAWRTGAVERGRARCEQYSWEACVEGIVGIYRAAATGSGRRADRT